MSVFATLACLHGEMKKLGDAVPGVAVPENVFIWHSHSIAHTHTHTHTKKIFFSTHAFFIKMKFFNNHLPPCFPFFSALKTNHQK
jgi:hypothetical protein